MRNIARGIFLFVGVSAVCAVMAPFLLYGSFSVSTLRHSVFLALGDELINLVFVDRISGNIFGSQSLWDGRFFFPYANSLTYSENLLLPSLVYRFWLELTSEKILSYHLMIFSVLGMNAGAMFLFCRSFFSRATSFLAGLFFAFNMLRLAQMSHIQLFAQMWFPFFAWSCYRYHRHPSIARAALMGGALAGQFYSGIYLGLMLAVASFPFIWMEFRSQKNPSRFVGHALTGVLINGLLVAPIAIPYYQMSGQFSVVRDIDEARQYAAYIWSYLSPSPDSFHSVLAGWVSAGRHLHEKRLFVGVVVLAFAIYVAKWVLMARRWGFWEKTIGLTTAYSVWLSLGPNAVLYAVLYYVMPGFKAMRAPARFGFVFLFFVVWIAAVGLERVLSRSTSKAVRRVAVLSLGILFVVENHFTIGLVTVPRYLEGAAQFLASVNDHGAVVHLPVRQDYEPFPGDRGNFGNNREAVRMYYGLFHSHPIANGYSGFSPPLYYEYAGAEATHGPGEGLVRELKRLGAQYAVLEKSTFPILNREAWTSFYASRRCLFDDGSVCVFAL